MTFFERCLAARPLLHFAPLDYPLPNQLATAEAVVHLNEGPLLPNWTGQEALDPVAASHHCCGRAICSSSSYDSSYPKPYPCFLMARASGVLSVQFLDLFTCMLLLGKTDMEEKRNIRLAA